MSEVRVYIADDEAPARARMKELLADIGGEFATRIVGESDNGLDVIDRLPGSGDPLDCHGRSGQCWHRQFPG